MSEKKANVIANKPIIFASRLQNWPINLVTSILVCIFIDYLIRTFPTQNLNLPSPLSTPVCNLFSSLDSFASFLGIVYRALRRYHQSLKSCSRASTPPLHLHLASSVQNLSRGFYLTLLWLSSSWVLFSLLRCCWLWLDLFTVLHSVGVDGLRATSASKGRYKPNFNHGLLQEVAQT